MARFLGSTILIIAAALFLSGCGWMVNNLPTVIPHWAGGEPAGAPPRPGTPAYDEYVKKLKGTASEPAPTDKPPQSNEPASDQSNEPAPEAR
jgi:hypothetical protein